MPTPSDGRVPLVLEQPRYIQNSFSIVFPEYRGITEREREIFSRLKGLYFPAKFLQGSPDAGEGHRLLFRSQHGHSQIIVTESSITLNVAYSPDWQTEPALARTYVAERTTLLFEVLEQIEAEASLFCGSVTRVQNPIVGADEDVADFVAEVFAAGSQGENYHDVTVRRTVVVDDLYFSNVVVQNYRVYDLTMPSGQLIRLSRAAASERGFEVISDFNSRYAFNEDKSFVVTPEAALSMIDSNFSAAQRTIGHAREAANERQA